MSSFGRDTIKTTAQQLIYELVRAIAIWAGISKLEPVVRDWAMRTLAMSPQAAVAWTILLAIVLVAMWLAVTDRFSPRRLRLRREQFAVPDRAEWNAASARLKEVYQKKFRNEVVIVDGHLFKNCMFQGVTLEFRGSAPFHFENCTFIHKNDIHLQTPNPAIQGFMRIWEGLREVPGFDRQFVGTKDEHGNIKPLPTTVRPKPTTPSHPNQQLQLRPAIEIVGSSDAGEGSGSAPPKPPPQNRRKKRRR